MYKKKSDIIKQIQSYHKQLSELYLGLYEKIEMSEIKSLLYDLYKHEKSRENYLEKHAKIAKIMDSWLNVPYKKLSQQISDCFDDLEMNSIITMHDILKIELHFDNCLIKLYNLLSVENEMNESLTNVFYYMLKKTNKEEELLTKMFQNSTKSVQYNSELKNFSEQNYTN